MHCSAYFLAENKKKLSENYIILCFKINNGKRKQL